MAKTSVEIGQSFRKTGSPLVVWVLDSYVENTDPVHVRLVKADDPMTRITVSVDVLSDPRHWMGVDT